MNITYEYKGNAIQVELADDLSPFIHFHRHIEIIYMLDGNCRAYCDFEEYALAPGDLFIAFPNQIHYYLDGQDLRAILIILPIDFFTDYAGILLSKAPEKPVVYGADSHPQLKGLIESLYLVATSDDPYQKEILKGYSSAFMGVSLNYLTLQQSKNDITDSLHSILSYCEQNYKNNISLDDVSHALHLSKYHISRIFSGKIQISFNDFINQLRIDEACRLLRNAATPITGIAYEVGFGSIRSFNRAFEKFMGCSPRDYQKSRSPQENESKEGVL